MAKKKVETPAPKQLIEIANDIRELLITKEKLSAREVMIVLKMVEADATLILVLGQLARMSVNNAEKPTK